MRTKVENLTNTPMSPPMAILSSQKQITVPAAVCKIMNLSPGTRILFLEFRPGEFQLAAVPKSNTKKHWENWAKNLAGKYCDTNIDKIDGVQSLLDDRKEDLILEERKYLQ